MFNAPEIISAFRQVGNFQGNQIDVCSHCPCNLLGCIAVVIDAGELLLIAAHMLAHHLVEVVVLVGILFALGGTALLQQVAQRIVGVAISEGIVGIDLQLAGAAGEPV